MTGLEYYNISNAGEDYAYWSYDTFARHIAEMIKSRFPEYVDQKNKVLVDLGSGPGLAFQHFESFGVQKIIAVDALPQMLSHIPQVFLNPNVEVIIQQADIFKDVVNVKKRSVDIVLCCSVTSFSSELEHLFSEASRMLKYGGFFGFTVLVHQESGKGVFLVEGHEPDLYVFPLKYLQSLCERNSLEFVEQTKLNFDFYVEYEVSHFAMIFKKKFSLKALIKRLLRWGGLFS